MTGPEAVVSGPVIWRGVASAIAAVEVMGYIGTRLLADRDHPGH